MKAGSVTVGETLSHARRTRGLSVDDVAADTCIRATLIYAIEADDFHMCGGDVYARGHIRSIARFVGVDAGPLIGQFDAAHGATTVVAAVAAQSTDRAEIARSEHERHINWTLATAAALVVVCAAALVGLLHDRGHHGLPKQTIQTATGHVHKTSPTVAPSTPPPSTVVATEPVTHATLTVRTVHGETWLSITTKTGKTLFDGLLHDGEQRVFSSHHDLRYTIGNAPAVDVVVNGNDIGSPPASGLVARGKVRPGPSSA
jgi:cytoskeleton protein RodZ